MVKGFQPLHIFAKSSILHVWQCFECIFQRFSEHVFPNTCIFLHLLMASSIMLFQTMSSKGGLSSVCSKNFVNFCVVLLPVFKPKFLQVQVVSKDGVPIMSLYYTFGGHLCKKNKKNKWSNCCLLSVWRGLEIPWKCAKK